MGSPSHQVIRFQAMAPISPANTTLMSTMSSRTSPLPTVLATAVPTRNAATKLKNAAQMTATPGERTRVPTTVAIELALSWKPLMKSKASATSTTSRTKTTGSSGISCA